MNQRTGTALAATAATGAQALPGYDGFRAFLERACGISLGEGKAYLVESRLRATMRELGVDTLDALVHRVSGAGEAALRQRIVDAMTTNETLWFRDEHPFETLRERILPSLDGGRSPIRIWSAGCSTGQEPYSISMVVDELERSTFRRLESRVEIVATDLSPSALETARAARYAEHALRRGIDETRRRQHFEPGTDEWSVAARLRERVTFSQLNLLDGYLMLGRFDVIFCRNVLIYFTLERRRDILERMGATLSTGGFLVLGGTESLPAGVPGFERDRETRGLVYRRV